MMSLSRLVSVDGLICEVWLECDPDGVLLGKTLSELERWLQTSDW